MFCDTNVELNVYFLTFHTHEEYKTPTHIFSKRVVGSGRMFWHSNFSVSFGIFFELVILLKKCGKKMRK